MEESDNSRRSCTKRVVARVVVSELNFLYGVTCPGVVQQSLIGCYISMTDNALYGKELSWYAIEILGHQFNPVTSNSSNSREMQEYEKFNYDHKYSRTSKIFGLKHIL